MAAQGFLPQIGSGADQYEEWAISDQYGPEDWENFAYMQENSTTNFDYDTYPPEEIGKIITGKMKIIQRQMVIHSRLDTQWEQISDPEKRSIRKLHLHLTDLCHGSCFAK